MGLDRSSDPKSDIQRLKDALFLDTAEKPNLDEATGNLGFNRPIWGWSRDDYFRAAAKKLAVTPHTPLPALFNLCELVFGPDITKIGTIAVGEGSAAEMTGTVASPYAITSGSNDLLSITAQGIETKQVSLPVGGAITATQVANAINTADPELQVIADTVSSGGNTYLRLTATGNIKGIDSVITIEAIPRSARTILGLSEVVHGHEDVGEDSYLVKLDPVNPVFPQVGDSLYVDEHGPNQEIKSYKFREALTNIFALEDGSNFKFNHTKYLPYAGTELTSDVSKNTESFSVLDATGFPTAGAPVSGVDSDYFAVIINRGGDTEEYLNIQQRAGTVFTPSTDLQYDHRVGESVELVFTQTEQPTIVSDTAPGSAILTLNDTSIFPKADFTIIVERGTRREETFWISENDLTGAGSSGIPNTLIIDGTQQPTAPAVTTFSHDAESLVEIAQVQLKGCDWIISQARATGEVVINVPSDCAANKRGPDRLSYAYLHEEIEPASLSSETDIVATALTKKVHSGESSIRVSTTLLHQLWGGPDIPPGPREQSFEDLRILGRVVDISDGSTTARKLLTNVLESTKLIQQLDNSVYSGYEAGDTLLKVKSTRCFINQIPPFRVRINRGGANEETVTVISIDHFNNTFTISSGLVNGHCNYDDLDTPANAQGNPEELFELDDSILGVTLLVGDEFESDIELPATVTIVNSVSDNFLYDPSTTDSFGQTPDTLADNLQDGGWLPIDKTHIPSNGKFPGYYIHEPGDHQPRGITAKLANTTSAVYPEAINSIPAHTELLGYCSDLAGNGFVAGTVPAGSEYLVFVDVRLWPTAFPYPFRLGEGVNREILNVANRNSSPAVLSSLPGIGPTQQPGVLRLVDTLSNTHEGRDSLGNSGEFAVLRVEQLLLDSNAAYFPTSSGWAFIDFGYNSQELFKFTSRDGRALILDDHEFMYQHPVTVAPYDSNVDPEFAGIPTTKSIVTLATDKKTFGIDGLDYPIHLPGDPTAVLLGFAGEEGIVDKIRAAGIKIVVEVQELGTQGCVDPAVLTGTGENWPVGVEGQTARAPSGEIYQYSLDLAAWLPTEWYQKIDADVAVRGTFTGAGTPGSETSDTPPSPVNWSPSASGGGSVTTTGADYSLDGSGAAADTALIELNPVAGTDIMGLIVDVVISALTGADDEETSHIALSLSTGADKAVFVNIGHVVAGDLARLVDSSNSQYSGIETVPTGIDDLTAEVRRIEIYFDSDSSGKVSLYVDHFLVQEVNTSSLTDSLSLMRCRLGDNSSGGGRETLVRNGKQVRIA